jgi:hypothetical protein
MGLWQRDITRRTMPRRHRLVTADDGPRPGTTLEKGGRTAAGVFRPDGDGHGGQLLPA